MPELPAGHCAATCPRCGQSFTCGAGADREHACFCVSIALGPERLVELQSRYSGCLCAACLTLLGEHPDLQA